MLRIMFSFMIVYKNVFSFSLIEALDSKRILNTLKIGITLAMECVDVAAFTFAT